MPAVKVIIVTPAPPGSRSGNRNTAARWARLLRELGYRVSVQTQWRGEPCGLLVVLHARKGHDALDAFRTAHPDRPALLALTGTDIYRDIRQDSEAAASLDRATRLIVLQEAALAELTPAQRRKACVIHQSVTTALIPSPPLRKFRICLLGHLREEKDPFLLAHALRLLPDPDIEAIHAGASLSQAMAREAARHMRKDPRYRWVGELAHWAAMRLLSRSHVMVITSVMEGGAHVVSEAIAIGIPVIASDIPGNRGLLGDDYPAYFPVGDRVGLAALVRLAIDDARFRRRLAAATTRRRPLVDAGRERRSWQRLLQELDVRSSY
jgi:putative glycosyltransferase (TIGR04348 family)